MDRAALGVAGSTAGDTGGAPASDGLGDTRTPPQRRQLMQSDIPADLQLASEMLSSMAHGWIEILAGGALTTCAAPRSLSRLEGWGERLLGIGLVIEGVATHLEPPGTGRLEWFSWVALAFAATGACLAVVISIRRGRAWISVERDEYQGIPPYTSSVGEQREDLTE